VVVGVLCDQILLTIKYTCCVYCVYWDWWGGWYCECLESYCLCEVWSALVVVVVVLGFVIPSYTYYVTILFIIN